MFEKNYDQKFRKHTFDNMKPIFDVSIEPDDSF